MDKNEAIALLEAQAVEQDEVLHGKKWAPFILRAIIAADKAAYQSGIEDAIKAVPSTCDMSVRAEYDAGYVNGYDACRAETLRRLGGLK